MRFAALIYLKINMSLRNQSRCTFHAKVISALAMRWRLGRLVSTDSERF